MINLTKSINIQNDLYTYTGRRNANNADLNRNFPSQFHYGRIGQLKKMSYREIMQLSPSDTTLRNNRYTQPETRAIMKWVLENPFVLSLILHGGAAGAFYPYDDGKSNPLSADPSNFGYLSATPDNNVMKHLANVYASNHLDMHLGKPCSKGYAFKNGIGNGAEWYPLSGSMNDFNYIFSNAFEVTVELTCCKKPDPGTLPSEWKKNKKSLIEYLKQAHIGIKGIVTDKGWRRVGGAEIIVVGNEKKIFTSDRGEYWRLLIPGVYQVYARDCSLGDCLQSITKTVRVRKNKATIVNFQLKNSYY